MDEHFLSGCHRRFEQDNRINPLPAPQSVHRPQYTGKYLPYSACNCQTAEDHYMSGCSKRQQ